MKSKPEQELTRLFAQKPLVRTAIESVNQVKTGESQYFIDFGKAVFGTVRLTIPSVTKCKEITVHLGEALSSKHNIDRQPVGSILYRRINLELHPGVQTYTLTVPRDERNTGKGAVLMPEAVGEVMPFRYCELENMTFEDFTVHQIMVHYPFDDKESCFNSSDSTLNAVWDLCKYSIKATTFCGIYVDGDRERIPYEADAYINQLSHYCVDREYSLARQTEEYLFQYPTWPTEWQMHMVLMAWADWMYTGDISFLEKNYSQLRYKSLVDLAREDGLISTQTDMCTREFEEKLNLYNAKYIFSHGLRDLVDWPPGSFTEGGQGERDNHEMVPFNTVVNAFHYRSLVLMSRIADLLKKEEDHLFLANQAEKVKEAINRVLFDSERQIYIDGEGAAHASLHSNMFPLAFGLVPEKKKTNSVVKFVKSRGMACSVYAAQYLLEALYIADEVEYALQLMAAKNDRSWWNMVASGSTMTLEAWDWKYKNNLDWNHAWGAVPANIIPRYLMGIRPLEPGFGKILIQPRPGSLKYVECRCPTIHGAVTSRIERMGNGSVRLDVEIPSGTSARIEVPSGVQKSRFKTFDNIQPGKHTYIY